MTNGKRKRKRTAKGKALEEENGNKEDLGKKDEIGNKEESGDNQGDKQAPAKKKKKAQPCDKKSKQSAEVEAAQLRAIQFFKTLENPVSTGDKPPVVTDKDDMTCAEQTQQERTMNTNVQLTPITNEQRTPVTNNVQQTPNTNMQRTPITNDVQRTPNVQRDNMQSLNATKQNGTLQTSMTQLVRDVPKGEQNNVTPPTYRTLTSTNDVTPLVPSVPLATVPKSSARLFGTQATSYTDLLSQTTDDDDFSLSYAVGGAIRHSYNCDEEVTGRDVGDKMDRACPDCSFYKAQNEELQEELQKLKEKCGSKYYNK